MGSDLAAIVISSVFLVGLAILNVALVLVG